MASSSPSSTASMTWVDDHGPDGDDEDEHDRRGRGSRSATKLRRLLEPLGDAVVGAVVACGPTRSAAAVAVGAPARGRTRGGPRGRRCVLAAWSGASGGATCGVDAVSLLRAAPAHLLERVVLLLAAKRIGLLHDGAQHLTGARRAPPALRFRNGAPHLPDRRRAHRPPRGRARRRGETQAARDQEAPAHGVPVVRRPRQLRPEAHAALRHRRLRPAPPRRHLRGAVARAPSPAASRRRRAARTTDTAAPQAAPAPVEGTDFSGTQRAGGGHRRARCRQDRRPAPVHRAGPEALRVRPDGRGAEARRDGLARELWPASCCCAGTSCSSCRAASAVVYPVDAVARPAQTDGAPSPSIAPVPYLPQTKLLELDADTLQTIRTLEVPGSVVGGRLRGRTARIAIATPSGLLPPEDLPMPVRQWVPALEVTRQADGRVVRRSIAPCTSIRRPEIFAGLGLLTLLTIDLDKGLVARRLGRDHGRRLDGLRVGEPDVLRDRALARSDRPRRGHRARPLDHDPRLRRQGWRPDRVRRQRQRARLPAQPVLDVGAQGRPARRDDRRPAVGPDRPDRRERELRHRARRVARARSREVGRVGGLGKGERIYSVRFVEDVGFVVTFRQVDPLYTLDLSEPRRAARRRRAEDPRLLLLPAPDRRRARASASARTRPTSRPHARLAGLAVRRLRPRRPDAPAPVPASASTRRRRPSTTTTPSCTGRRRSCSSCRSPLRRQRGRRSPARRACASTAHGITEVGRVQHPVEGRLRVAGQARPRRAATAC